MNAEITKHLDDDIWELRLETIVYSTFSIKIILMYYFISFERNLKKRPSAKLKAKAKSATTIFAEGDC